MNMKTLRPLRRLATGMLLTSGMLAASAWATEYFVDNNRPDDSGNGLSWATAEKTIAAAVADATTAGDIVTVSNGTYDITAEIAIANDITVRSYSNGVYGGLTNAAATIVQRSSGETRIFNITHANAVIEGFTIQNGYGNGALYRGLGVNMTGGLVRDCIIQNQTYSHADRGGGVYMTGGTVSNCIVRGTLLGNASMGGGIFAGGSSQVLNSQILDNGVGSSGDFNGFGGGIYVDGANVVVRNCLIAHNYTGNGSRDGSYNQGAGVYLNGGLVENCTIASNSIRYFAFGLGAGIYRNGNGTVRNCIIYFNRDIVEGVTDNWYSTDADAEPNYTCLTPTNSLPPGTIGNIAADPLFVNLAAGDYHLSFKPAVSPCIDAGTNQAWMATAKDLDGKARIQKGIASPPTVDMGAYETLVPTKGTVVILR